MGICKCLVQGVNTYKQNWNIRILYRVSNIQERAWLSLWLHVCKSYKSFLLFWCSYYGLTLMFIIRYYKLMTITSFCVNIYQKKWSGKCNNIFSNIVYIEYGLNIYRNKVDDYRALLNTKIFVKLIMRVIWSVLGHLDWKN